MTMAAMPSCPAGRRGGVSAEVYREEDAACYVKKVIVTHIITDIISKHHLLVHNQDISGRV